MRRQPDLGFAPLATVRGPGGAGGYFYDGLSDAERAAQANDAEPGGEMFARKETLDLIRAYYQLGERPRRRLLDLAKSLNGDNDAA